MLTEGKLCPLPVLFPLYFSSSVFLAYLEDFCLCFTLNRQLLMAQTRRTASCWTGQLSVLLPGISVVCHQKCPSSVCGCMAMAQVKTTAEHKQLPWLTRHSSSAGAHSQPQGSGPQVTFSSPLYHSVGPTCSGKRYLLGVVLLRLSPIQS